MIQGVLCFTKQETEIYVLGCSDSDIDNAVRKGRLVPSYDEDGKMFFSEQALKDYQLKRYKER